MWNSKNTTYKSLLFASVLALTGGVAIAEQQDPGPNDGDRPTQRQGDRDGKRHHARHDGQEPRGKHGERGERHERAGQDRRQRMHHRLFAGMELTDEQKESIHEVMKSHGDARKAWHEEHKDEFQTIRQKMQDARSAGDKDAMQAARDEIKALMESAPKPDAAHDQVRALLNEEQQATFDERIAKFREHMQQWRERPHDGRGPNAVGPNGEEGPDHHGPDARRRHAGRLFGNLDLSDEQRNSIRDTMQGNGTREEKLDAVRELLGDDQKARLKENIQKMREAREKRQAEQGEPGEHRRHHNDDGEGRKRHPRQNNDANDHQPDPE